MILRDTLQDCLYVTIHVSSSDLSIRACDWLYVEDNRGDVTLMRIGLQEYAPGVHLYAVGTGKDGIQFLQKNGPYINAPTPNLVLVDYSLPDMTGGEMFRTVKQSEGLRDIPILIFTSMDEKLVTTESYWLEDNAIVRKPSSLQELYRIVGELVRFSSCDDALLKPEALHPNQAT